jgi:hypothetical protein
VSIDHWLFAPVDPRIARIFRVLLVLTMLPVFWPNERPLLGVIARRPELALLWSQVFLTPGWAAIALPALAAFGLGWGGRAMGWLAAALLLPLVFVPAMQSRQVLWLALLVLSLLHSGRSRSPGPGTAAGPLWPVRLLQLQLSTLYAANAWGKLTPEYLL